MKSVLILSCLLGMSLAAFSQYPEEPMASPSEDESLSMMTAEAKGRSLKEEPITGEELKQMDGQMANQKAEPMAPKGRHLQNPRPVVTLPQAYFGYNSPFFASNPFQPNLRAGAAVPASQAVSVEAIPQAAFPQQAVNEVPIAAYPQYPFRAQPVYVLNPAGYEAGYGYQASPQYNPQQNPQSNHYRTFSIQTFPTTVSTSPGVSVVNPVGGIAFCKWNIFTQKTECYGW